MAAPAHTATKLAYDDEGAGAAVAFLHGLTFDRRTWRPIIERLDSSSMRSIAVDLPAHGESGGAPAPLEEVVVQVHELLVSLTVERPVVVGHSMSGALAAIYGTAYPARGVVMIDNGPTSAHTPSFSSRSSPRYVAPDSRGCGRRSSSPSGSSASPSRCARSYSTVTR
jgi:pimeloyl-ACP methyl ester carboxylesterase